MSVLASGSGSTPREVYQPTQDYDALEMIQQEEEDSRVGFRETRRLLEREAEQGDPQSQYFFGMMCENGKGGPVDLKKAYEMYTHAAKRGYTPALFNIALMHVFRKGVRGNQKYSLNLIKGAAAQNYPSAKSFHFMHQVFKKNARLHRKNQRHHEPEVTHCTSSVTPQMMKDKYGWKLIPPKRSL